MMIVKPNMIKLQDIAAFLDEYLRGGFDYAEDPAGIWRASEKPVRRIGLALEATPDLAAWVKNQNLDALFLHRAWSLDQLENEQAVSSDTGVLAYHLAFDERLTLGFNKRLAAILGLRNAIILGEKLGRPIGMSGEIAATEFNDLIQKLNDIFQGTERINALRLTANLFASKHFVPNHCASNHQTSDKRFAEDETSLKDETEVTRIAVVGAMNDELVRAAANRGAAVYITGQWRQQAAFAVEETGIGVVCIGHKRTENWALRALAGVLRERWARLQVAIKY